MGVEVCGNCVWDFYVGVVVCWGCGVWELLCVGVPECGGYGLWGLRYLGVWGMQCGGSGEWVMQCAGSSEWVSQCVGIAVCGGCSGWGCGVWGLLCVEVRVCFGCRAKSNRHNHQITCFSCPDEDFINCAGRFRPLFLFCLTPSPPM